jgi:hypothetical protein
MFSRQQQAYATSTRDYWSIFEGEKRIFLLNCSLCCLLPMALEFLGPYKPLFRWFLSALCASIVEGETR